MNDKKTISINTAFFKQGGSNKSSNQTRSKKPKPLSIISPNDLKRNLIKKVKEHQHNLHKSYTSELNNNKDNYNTSNTINNSQNRSNNSENRFFPDEFKESLDYLVQLSKQNKANNQEKHLSSRNDVSNHNTYQTNVNSFYNSPSNFQMEQVDIDLPNTLKQDDHNNVTIVTNTNSQNNNVTREDKPYGCLKNGMKPTYRTYMKTLKNRNNSNDHMKKLSQFTSNSNVKIKDNNIKSKRVKYIKKQIKTRRFKCGKNKQTRKVGVVLKSGKTRSKVLAEKQTIKARPYAQMKNELYKKGFLKIGTSAPKELVSEIYENCIFAGDVLNKNKDVLIHNYMNDNQKEY